MKTLGLDEIERAFSIMGEFLRERKTIGEIAVYGGSAIMLQFDWRGSTRDVDAVVVSGASHGLVRQAADRAARDLGLERSWLSEAVAQYKSAKNDSDGLIAVGMYPKSGVPGLRVNAARPEYLLAMKLAALQRAARDDRDFEDSKMLAAGLGVHTPEALESLYDKFFPADPLAVRARLRLSELALAIQALGAV